MIKQLLNKYRHRRAVEHGATIHPWDQGRFRVALVYPNNYSNGMSNLGFQTVYQMINQREDCLCERFSCRTMKILTDAVKMVDCCCLWNLSVQSQTLISLPCRFRLKMIISICLYFLNWRGSRCLVVNVRMLIPRAVRRGLCIFEPGAAGRCR